jgi:hypothetical protein
MSVPAGRARHASAADASTIDFGREPSLGTLDIGEPLYPPPRRGSSMLSAALVLIVLFGAGWAYMQAPAEWLALLGAKVASLAAPMQNSSAMPAVSDASSIATGEVPPGAEAVAAQVPPENEKTIEIANNAATPPDAERVETGSIAATAEPSEPQPLPPLRVDPADPYQKRAVAAGLHPDLSRVLLARLSAGDYRNAGYAVDTAVAKTADEAVFVWPRQRKPEQALFRVHFVKGAAAECRRYVVTVVKDGWTTTASPMERCGAQLAGRKATANSTPPKYDGR